MNENEREGSRTYFYVQSVKEVAWLFKQQIEFFLTRCSRVAKSFSVLCLVQDSVVASCAEFIDQDDEAGFTKSYKHYLLQFILINLMK